MSLRKTLYPKVEPIVTRIVSFLTSQGISPNQLTVSGLALNFLTGVIYAKGYFFLGGVLLIIAGACDLIDGPLARATGKANSFGAFFDSTLDRYSDFFVFAGLSVYFVRHDEIFWFLVSLGIILGAFAVSYTKARAENFIRHCGIGIFGRAERILIMAAATILSPLLKAALLILLAGTHATAIQRIFHTKKVLAETSTE